MFQVADIYEEAKIVTGVCDETRLFQWITDSIQMVANKSDFEGWICYVDMCVDGTCVTLPREVETVMGVNIGGCPTLARDQLFNFHLNGPGDCGEVVQFRYQDKGFFPTFRDIKTPQRLIAFVEQPEDENAMIRVYGKDNQGAEVRQKVNNVWQDGWLIPTVFGLAIPDVGMPDFATITRVSKARTNGRIRLSTLDSSGTSGVVIGIYEADETEPMYRRITLGKTATWIRLAYRKANPIIRHKSDRVPLRNRLALIFALKALKFYHEDDIANAQAYELNATRLEREASDIATAPTSTPLQVLDYNNPQDKSDIEIV